MVWLNKNPQCKIAKFSGDHKWCTLKIDLDAGLLGAPFKDPDLPSHPDVPWLNHRRKHVQILRAVIHPEELYEIRLLKIDDDR